MKCADLVNRYTITKTVSYFLKVRGKPPTKSIVMRSLFHFGIYNL